MIRLVVLSSGPDGQSHVEERVVRLTGAGRDQMSEWLTAGPVRFQESPPGTSFDWHPAPHRQLVVTLSGTLEFETRGGETFRLAPGDVLLADDTAGGGHRWSLIDDQPWRRLYVQLPKDVQP